MSQGLGISTGDLTLDTPEECLDCPTIDALLKAIFHSRKEVELEWANINAMSRPEVVYKNRPHFEKFKTYRIQAWMDSIGGPRKVSFQPMHELFAAFATSGGLTQAAIAEHDLLHARFQKVPNTQSTLPPRLQFAADPSVDDLVRLTDSPTSRQNSISLSMTTAAASTASDGNAVLQDLDDLIDDENTADEADKGPPPSSGSEGVARRPPRAPKRLFLRDDGDITSVCAVGGRSVATTADNGLLDVYDRPGDRAATA